MNFRERLFNRRFLNLYFLIFILIISTCITYGYDSFHRKEIKNTQIKLEKFWNKYNLKETGFTYKTKSWYHYTGPVAFTIIGFKKIYIDALYYENLSENALAFVVFHELGHHYAGRDQIAASCWAVEEMKRRNIPLSGVYLDQGVIIKYIKITGVKEPVKFIYNKDHILDLEKKGCLPTSLY